MIAAILLSICRVHGSDSASPSPVQAFTAAYVGCESPEGEALARRERGLDTILDAMRRHYSASADFGGGGYGEEDVNCILNRMVEWGFVAPLTSFGDQLEDLSGAQRAVAADLVRLLLSTLFFSDSGSMFLHPSIHRRRVSVFGKALRFISEVVCYCGTRDDLPGGAVHHGNKYWYRETLCRVIRAKEAYYDTLIGFHPEDRYHGHDTLKACLQKVKVRDVIDDILGFGLVCYAVDASSGSSARFTIYETPVMSPYDT